MFACEHHGLEPDMLCLAKAIAGGIPMGAVLLDPRVGELPSRVHGATFGGNPLACAAALATIRTIEEEALPQRAAELGAYFLSRLQDLDSPLIREVRGLGLMVAIELKRRAKPYLEALMTRGALALSAGPIVMRFLPPLVISQEDLETVARTVEEVLSSGGNENG
jgi:acetylornithine/LysW-gamma-L-lysine aminotransferase